MDKMKIDSSKYLLTVITPTIGRKNLDDLIQSIENQISKGKTLIYICRNKTCFSPVETVTDALHLLGMA